MKQGKKMSKETKRKMSLAQKGNKKTLGKHWKVSEIGKQNISKSRKGKKSGALDCHWKHSEEAKRKIGLVSKGNKYRLGKKHSQKTKRKMSLSHKGEKSYLWKGGITPVRLHIRSSMKYMEWRQSIFLKDNFTCQKCKMYGGKLHAHHIKRFSILLTEAKKYLPLLPLYEAAMIYSPLWDIKNGITLCEKCHKKTKNYSRKGGKNAKKI